MNADEIREHFSVLAPTAKAEGSEAICAIAIEIAAQLADLNDTIVRYGEFFLARTRK